MKVRISIVMPCYNGSSYISETLESILNQSESSFELIIIDDGSTDDSKSKICKYSDARINYIFQENQGVSNARNNGYLHVRGDYVLFFDADDIMSEDFLSSRINYLNENSNIDFISGPVIKFSDNQVFTEIYSGVGTKAIEEILLYDKSVITCPSNYLFRRKFLDKYSLKFNVALSSTADRYFLIECSKYGKSINLPYLKSLMYRISEKSMSHLLTKGLVIDNEEFYSQLEKNCLIPNRIRKESLFLGYYMLFGAYWKLNCKYLAFKFAIKSFAVSPSFFFRNSVRKI